MFLEFSTDNAYDRRGENSSYNKIGNGTSTANLDVFKSYFSSSYAKIARSNYFLENIEKLEMDESKKNRFIAHSQTKSPTPWLKYLTGSNDACKIPFAKSGVGLEFLNEFIKRFSSLITR